MPIGTAFHERTFPLCESLSYREWSGYYAVSSYEPHHEHEYNAIRNAAALIDISPLFKYRLTGKDATRLVDRVITRDMRKVAVGQVVYTPWCDERGKVIDDGTVSRLEENTYRWTAADPSLRWFTQNAAGMDVQIEDISESVSALALQGPTSGRLLKSLVEDAEVANLKYFRVTKGTIAGVPVEISRTGYTGDLGYEIWMRWEDATRVWDALVRAGAPFDLRPSGMLALDVARIEAAGLDRQELARNFVRGAVKMVMIDGFFHADPHPGNIVVELASGRLTFLDTGMTGELDLGQRITLARFLLAFRDKDVSGLATTLRSLSSPFRTPDERSYERQFAQRIGPLIQMLGPYHSEYRFRYRKAGFMTVTETRVMCKIAEKLIGQIAPTVNAAMRAHIAAQRATKPS